MSKYLRPVNQSSRSLLLDHKNKLKPHPSPKKLPPKPKSSKANSRHMTVLTSSTNITSQECSPLPVSQPLEQREPYSKSEEETKAEEDRQQMSPIVGRNWEGVVGQYRQQIIGYVLKREEEFHIDGGYLHHSHILSAKMRTYLIRHLFKICTRFELLRTTLHLSVLYLDLYFSRHLIISDQMEGILSAQACLFIAMKYEEIYPPDLKKWVDRRHKNDVIKLEAKVLSVLNYQLAHYTVQHYLRLEEWERGEEVPEKSTINLMADLSLFDLNIRQLQASQVAKCIRALVRNEAGDYKIEMALKWMVERNEEALHWLRQQKYGWADEENERRIL